jgi:hypothetical protein
MITLHVKFRMGEVLIMKGLMQKNVDFVDS